MDGMTERSDPRRGVSLIARYGVVTGTTLFEGVGADLSVTGMFIGTRRPLGVGMRVRIDCEPYDRDGRIRGTAEVIWTRKSADGPNRPAGMGLQFVELEGDSRTLIDEMLRVGDASSAGTGGRRTESKPPPEPASVSASSVTAEASPVREVWEPPDAAGPAGPAAQAARSGPVEAAGEEQVSDEPEARISRLEALIDSTGVVALEVATGPSSPVIDATPEGPAPRGAAQVHPGRSWLVWLAAASVALATAGWFAQRRPHTPPPAARVDAAPPVRPSPPAPNDPGVVEGVSNVEAEFVSAPAVAARPVEAAGQPAPLALTPEPTSTAKTPGRPGANADAKPRLPRPATKKRQRASPVAPPAASAPEPTEASVAQGPYEAASACIKRGDDVCALAALEGRTKTAEGQALLVETQRGLGRPAARDAAIRQYLARFPSGRDAVRYQRELRLRDASGQTSMRRADEPTVAAVGAESPAPDASGSAAAPALTAEAGTTQLGPEAPVPQQ